MRLIKKGKNPDNRIWRGKCNRCQSEFEINQSELTNIKSCPREAYDYAEVSCTECKGEIMFYPTVDYDDSKRIETDNR